MADQDNAIDLSVFSRSKREQTKVDTRQQFPEAADLCEAVLMRLRQGFPKAAHAAAIQLASHISTTYGL